MATRTLSYGLRNKKAENAARSRHRSCDGQAFVPLSLPGPTDVNWPPEVLETAGLIDVIWLRCGKSEIVSAFEIEESTSIYSGILRMEDPAVSFRAALLASTS